MTREYVMQKAILSRLRQWNHGPLRCPRCDELIEEGQPVVSTVSCVKGLAKVYHEGCYESMFIEA